MEANKSYPVFENSIADLKISSILDQGFFQMFGMSPELHSHSYYELLFPADGGFGIELTQREQKRVDKGFFCLIPPGIYHGTYPTSEHSKKLAIRFRYDRIAETEGKVSVYERFHQALSSCREISLFSAGERMNALFFLLQAELGSVQVASGEYLEAIMTQLYICMLRSMGEQQEVALGKERETPICDDRDQRRIRFEEYFQQHFHEEITEEHMAKEMNLSKRQISRVIREIYGKSFRQILIEERLNRAAQLLVTTERSVEEIAISVGYASLSGFYSAFQQKFGVSAGRYRRTFLKLY